MVEKVRLSLWDIFSFFLTGFLAATLLLAFMIGSGSYPLPRFVADLKDLDTAIILVVAPLTFILLGMLIEPVANYLDRVAIDPIYKKYGPATRRTDEEERPG